LPVSLASAAESAIANGTTSAGSVISTLFVVMLIGLSIGGYGGWSAHGWYDASAEKSAQKKVYEATAKETVRRGAIAQNVAQRKQQSETFYAQNPDWWIQLLAAHPNVGACDIGADGLREWNRWNQGPGPFDPTRPAQPVPGSAAGTKRPAAGSGGQPQTGDGSLLRLPSQGRGVDGSTQR
jgi:hypothetical protein